MIWELQTTPILPGVLSAKTLVLQESLSFWGGFDPKSGRIVDCHHPQNQATLTNRLLVLPASRGSAGTPAALAESFRLGTGPKGIVLAQADVNICVGAKVAKELYGVHVPILLAEHGFDEIPDGQVLQLDQTGRLTAER